MQESAEPVDLVERREAQVLASALTARDQPLAMAPVSRESGNPDCPGVVGSHRARRTFEPVRANAPAIAAYHGLERDRPSYTPAWKRSRTLLYCRVQFCPIVERRRQRTRRQS